MVTSCRPRARSRSMASRSMPETALPSTARRWCGCVRSRIPSSSWWMLPDLRVRYHRASDRRSLEDQMTDLSARHEPIDGASAWIGRDVQAEDYRVELSVACHDEIRSAVDE